MSRRRSRLRERNPVEQGAGIACGMLLVVLGRPLLVGLLFLFFTVVKMALVVGE